MWNKSRLSALIIKSLLILLGGFFIVFGGWDDSPGLQGLGLIIIVAAVVSLIRAGGRGSRLA